jgi:hypothetical protein
MPGPIFPRGGSPARAQRYAQVRHIVVPAGIPSAHLQPDLPGALGPEQGMFIRLPGVNFPPAGGIPVDTSGDADLAAGAVGQLLLVNVPTGSRFRMAGIGFAADDETALSFLTWTIQVDGQPVSGYTQQTAAVGSVRNLTEIFVLTGVSATVSVNVAIDATAAATYRYICRVRGWFYTEITTEVRQ